MTEEVDKKSRVVTLQTDLDCLLYNVDHGAPNFHAFSNDYKADLVIRVVDLNDKLQGCIPCDKVLMIKYSDTIAAKYRDKDSTLWKKEEGNGISYYELKVDVKPEIVCDFIKAIYEKRGVGLNTNRELFMVN